MVDAEARLEGFDPQNILKTCQDYLAGPWSTVTLEQFDYKPLT